MHKLKFNGKFEHGSNSCEMCQNNPFYLSLSFIWNFDLKVKTWNIFGFINSWYGIYLTHHSHGAFLGESVCISLLCGECILATHVLSECDTVAFLWGIAKMIVVIWYLANNWIWWCSDADVWRLSRHFIHCSMLWITFIGQHDDSSMI